MDKTWVLERVREIGSLAQVSDFLARKGIASTANSWDEAIDRRIKPALAKGQLTDADLLELLADVEEHGHQHVFLYRLNDSGGARALMAEGAIRRRLASAGLPDVIRRPRLLTRPTKLELAGIRHERLGKRDTMVIRAVETRTYRKRVDHQRKGDLETITYQLTTVLAVNLARLLSDGRLEVRIQSHENTSQDYRKELRRMMALLGEIIPVQSLAPWPLRRAKRRLYEQRDDLADRIQYRTWRMRNDVGNTIVAAPGDPQGSLFDDDGMDASVAEFLHHDAYCDEANCRWLAGHGGLRRGVHVHFGGESHEFRIGARIERMAYEHVFAEICRFNR